MFTAAEIEYLRSRPPDPPATVGGDGRPQVKPAGFLFDAETGEFVIGGVAGSGMAGSKKLRDITRNPGVAMVIDDIAAVGPWTPRGDRDPRHRPRPADRRRRDRHAARRVVPVRSGVAPGRAAAGGVVGHRRLALRGLRP